jgi:protein-tyrosine phosphatase
MSGSIVMPTVGWRVGRVLLTMTEHQLSAAALPPPRDAGSPYIIAMVCLGNICRSPMAQVVLTEKLRRAGLGDDVEVRSCGTGDWHVGEQMDRRAAATLRAHGYDPSLHRAAHFDASWLDASDAILAMDLANQRDIHRVAVSESPLDRVVMFRSFDPEAGDDVEVPDPWYSGPEGFEDVLAMVERATDVLVDEARSLRPSR